MIDMSMPALNLTDELAGELLVDLWKAAAFQESSLVLLSSIATDAEAKPEASRPTLQSLTCVRILFELSTSATAASSRAPNRASCAIP